MFRINSGRCLAEDTELNLGQRTHLAQRKLAPLLKNTYVALGIGITIAVLVLLVGIPSIQFIESFGTWEDRLFRAGDITGRPGPPCNPDFNDDPSKFPALVYPIPGTGAAQAGIQDGDIIIRINDLLVTSSSIFDGWYDKLPEVKPGDTVSVIVDRHGEQLPLSIKTMPHIDDPSKPMIGLTRDESFCSLVFIIDEGSEFSENSLALVLLGYWMIIFVVSVLGGVLVVAFVFWRSKINKLKNELEEWEGQYIEESYYLAFETNVLTGSTDGEKIFNMAQDIFPELRKQGSKLERWKGKVIGEKNYEFDCFQTTNEDVPHLFVAKHFGDDVITQEKIQELIKAIEKSKTDSDIKKKIKNLDTIEILRVICVGRKYEPKLLKDESRDEIMEEIESDYLIDLILEENEKYSVLSFEY